MLQNKRYYQKKERNIPGRMMSVKLQDRSRDWNKQSSTLSKFEEFKFQTKKTAMTFRNAKQQHEKEQLKNNKRRNSKK